MATLPALGSSVPASTRAAKSAIASILLSARATRARSGCRPPRQVGWAGVRVSVRALLDVLHQYPNRFQHFADNGIFDPPHDATHLAIFGIFGVGHLLLRWAQGSHGRSMLASAIGGELRV